MSLNERYLALLSQQPLLTKSCTTGVFSCLNEILASCFSGEFQTKRVTLLGRKVTIKHPFNPKIASMIIYGAMIATPISHFYYKLSNRVFKGKMSPKMKLLQLVTSLLSLSPFMSAVYVSWLSIINTYQVSGRGFQEECLRLVSAVKAGLKSNWASVYRTSAVTSLVALTTAQNFVPPELWVVFFNLIYFVIGTVQNTKIKIKQRNERLKKME